MGTGRYACGRHLRGTHRRDGSRYGALISVLLMAALIAGPSIAGASAVRRDSRDSSLEQKIPPPPLGIRGKWKLILNAPFTGHTLNTLLWRPGWFGSRVTGPINPNEIACYNPANVHLSGESVYLNVTKTSSRCKGKRRPYTGAVLSTDPYDGRSARDGFQYTYGVLQVRVYLPRIGAHFANWPAVVTFGHHWPQTGENDVLENIEGTVCSHFHSPANVHTGSGGCDSTLAPGWHTFSSNWEPGSVTWYCDGVRFAHITKGVTSAPMYIVLVNTVSIKAPALAQADSMRVSYVRVWQQ
jgi:Glycosyl hydrolases family 16